MSPLFLADGIVEVNAVRRVYVSTECYPINASSNPPKPPAPPEENAALSILCCK